MRETAITLTAIAAAALATAYSAATAAGALLQPAIDALTAAAR